MTRAPAVADRSSRSVTAPCSRMREVGAGATTRRSDASPLVPAFSRTIFATVRIMKITSVLCRSAVVCALTSVGAFAFSFAMTGCDSGGGAKSAPVTPGDMPAGETWSGVYFHPVYGYLHMLEQDTNVVGKWKRADQSAWGELSGTKVGNVLHFQWKEHKYGLVGPAAESHGKGVFIYKMN